MDKMTGIEATKVLRDNEKLKRLTHLPVVGVTSLIGTDQACLAPTMPSASSPFSSSSPASSSLRIREGIAEGSLFLVAAAIRELLIFTALFLWFFLFIQLKIACGREFTLSSTAIPFTASRKGEVAEIKQSREEGFSWRTSFFEACFPLTRKVFLSYYYLCYVTHRTKWRLSSCCQEWTM